VKNKKTLYEKLEWRKNKSTILASDTIVIGPNKKLVASYVVRDLDQISS